MAIEVRLFATLRDHYPPEAKEGVYYYEPQGQEKVKDLAEHLKLPFVQIHLVMLNGVQGSLEDQLKDGDRVGFFPPVGGG